MLALLALASAGCGECVFRVPVKGAVQDQTGRALEGVRITTCDREGNPSGTDPSCRTVVSDAQGQFSTESLMFRPKPGACAVHSLWLEKPGCRTTRQTLGHPPDEQTVTIPCGESPPGVEPATPPSVAPPPAGGVAAKITAGGESLAVETRNAVGWQPVCTTDCSVALDPAALYRVRGNGIVTSAPFSVPADRGPLRLEVNPGRQSRAVLGAYLGFPGLFASMLGGGLLLGGYLLSSGTPDDDRRDTKTALKTAGFVTLGVGLAAAIVGIGLSATNQETGVDVYPAP